MWHACSAISAASRVAVVKCVQPAEEGGAEAAGRAEPRARRDVGHRRDFQPFAPAGRRVASLADQRVLNFRDVSHPLRLQYLRIISGRMDAVDDDVNVPVDGRGDEENRA